ncbi:putative B3 domain-containing protein At1g78640 [Eucalyptus grandis]|uniref:putative B3 domain-containing protein At1g78640 n=1 Tax=Eucalyptus grandis TaxID=71139 RepID=UPI00192E94E9|nr:putative B3 domain-containing protein At1g78640 [Eucalyptus grandis]
MKLVDPFTLELPPTGDVPRGELHTLLPSIGSSSCVSFLHDHERNHEEEGGETSSAAVVVPARVFFPLTPDPTRGFLDTKELSAAPARPEQKSTASLTDDGTLIVDKKAKRCRSQKGRRGASECEAEEERCGDVSTELVLRYDPYKIKKTLKKSDLGHLSRLLIPRAGVAAYVLPCMDEERASRVKSSEGAEVVVWDEDTLRAPTGVCLLGIVRVLRPEGCWMKEFVQRRGLAEGNEIGICWDPIASKFDFSLLHKAN